MTDWIFAYDSFEPDRERQREALLTLANGYLGTRAAATYATADDVHYPGTYIAGVYNRTTSDIEGQAVEIESVPNAPNWLPLTWRIDDGSWFDLRDVSILSYRHALDLRRGVLTRECTVEDNSGRRTQIRERRLVHLREYHLAASETTITPENWSGRLEIRAEIDGHVRNDLVKDEQSLNNDHLTTIARGATPDGSLWLKARTNQSRIEIDVAARTSVTENGSSATFFTALEEDGDRPGVVTTVRVGEANRVVIEKIAAIYTSRDPAISESGLAARETAATAPGFEALLDSHIDAWERTWQRSDIVLEDGDGDTQLVLRLHLFHLLQTMSPHTTHLDIGVPARGLSGEGYHGHVFWDELLVLAYLNLHFPSVSRAMLRYRYLRLGTARTLAREAGYTGAMFPWQSGSSGGETTPAFFPNPMTEGWIADHTPLQRHIGAAIAYNAWQYYEVTRDQAYLVTEGAELLLEIARFWSSIATFNVGFERYEIHGVMGPDEFHSGYPWEDEPGLSNNTYTNVMAVRSIQMALDALAALPAWRRKELQHALVLGDEELDRWRDVARRMRVVFLESGELAQFEHYDRLEELDWDAYRERYGDVQRLDHILDAEGDTPNRYRINKQPDVLMLFFVFSRGELMTLLNDLGYDFDEDDYLRTFEFYSQRSTHGSTLSRVVEAEILADVDQSHSWDCLQEALRADVGDTQGGSTQEGIHLGAMAGTIAIVERRYAGIDPRAGTLHIDPSLPDQLKHLSMNLLYRGIRLEATLSHERLQLSTGSEPMTPVTVTSRDWSAQLTPDTPIDWSW